MATKKSPGKKSPSKSGKRSTTPPSKRWSAKVTSDSTHPPKGLFKKGAKTIAKTLEKKSVSPKGPGQAMQMLSFYENRAGKNLSAARRKTLEHAKDIIRTDEGKAKLSSTRKSTSKKSTKKSSTKKKAS